MSDADSFDGTDDYNERCIRDDTDRARVARIAARIERRRIETRSRLLDADSDGFDYRTVGKP